MHMFLNHTITQSYVSGLHSRFSHKYVSNFHWYLGRATGWQPRQCGERQQTLLRAGAAGPDGIQETAGG